MSENILISVFIFIFGAALGSFFNVCIYRIPRKESIVLTPSHCPHCNANIPAYLNIPIISFLVLRGKCHYCSHPIKTHYFIVELLTPFFFVLLFYLNNYRFDIVFFQNIIFVSFGIIIFFIDFYHKIIPDKLSLSLLVLGLFFAIFTQTKLDIKQALLGAATGFILFYSVAILFKITTRKDSLGGGDIKFITAAGSFLGFSGIIFTVLFGSVLALLILLVIKYDLRKEFPYGPFLVLGSITYLIFGEILIGFYLKLVLG